MGRISAFVSACLLAAACLAPAQQGSGSPPAAARARDLVFAAFPTGGAPQGGPRLEPSALAAAGIEVLAAEPIDPKRPLLLILDPSLGDKSELRRVVLAAAEALSPLRIRMRVAIPIVGGLRSGPFTAGEASASAIADAAANLIPDDPGQRMSLARMLDLSLEMAERVESEWGSLDCLIASADQSMDEEGADYLMRGLERRALEICSRAGSTLHLFGRGEGGLREICLATGGEVFTAAETAGRAVQRILDARAGGALLRVRLPETPALFGRVPLAYAGAARGPGGLWLHPSGTGAPDLQKLRQVQEWMRRLLEAHRDGNATQALQFAERAIATDAGDPEPFVEAGRLAMEVGDVSRAHLFLSQAVRFVRPPEDVVVLYARAAVMAGREGQALDFLQKAFSAGRPRTPALELELARLLVAAGRPAEARRPYETVLAAGPEGERSRSEYGHLLLALGEPQAALEEFKRALSRDENDRLALAGMAGSEAALGNTAEALRWAERGSRAFPRDADILLHGGRAFLAAANPDKAQALLQEARRTAPERRDILFALAQAQVEAGQAERAFNLLRGEAPAGGFDTRLLREIANLHRKVGNFGEAATLFEAAASLQTPEAAGFFGEAAALRERLGQHGQALLDYRSMLQSAPAAEGEQLAAELKPHLAALSLRIRGGETPLTPALAQELGIRLEQPPDESGAGAEGRLTLPGGLLLLSRMTGIDRAALREPDALARLFRLLLESSGRSDRLVDRTSRQELAAMLKHFESLAAFLVKNNLQPTPAAAGAPQEVVVPLAGDKAQVAATRKLLGFFGVNYNYRPAKAEKSPSKIEVTFRQNRQAQERQKLLQFLGVNLLDRKIREVRFAVGEDTLPLAGGVAAWAAILPKSGRPAGIPTLAAFIQSGRAMKLYDALAGCTRETRALLLGSLAPAALLSHAEALKGFGSYLDVSGGRVRVPGSGSAWAELLGTPPESGAAFLSQLLEKDRGAPLILYQALSGANEPVQRYLASTPARLKELYQALNEPAMVDASTAEFDQQDLGRIIRALQADSEGLFLPLDERFAGPLLGGARQGGTAASARLRVGAAQIGSLLRAQSPIKQNATQSFARSIPDFLRLLQQSRPRWITDKTIPAIMKDPALSAAALDLVWDIELPPELLVRYLDYCGSLAEAGDKGWNHGRTRTSQALFHLLSLLRREEAIGEQDALRLTAGALDVFSAGTEWEFSSRTARFLLSELLPLAARTARLPPSSPDLLLAVLAGKRQARDFYFQGSRYRFEGGAVRQARMKEALAQQRCTALPLIVEIVTSLARLAGEESGPPADPARLAGLVSGLDAARAPAETDRKQQPQAKPAAMRLVTTKVDALGKARTPPSTSAWASLAVESSSALNEELGVSLLAACYAYYSSPGMDALAFDPSFIRKHRFYPARGPIQNRWRQAKIEQDPLLGTFVGGSLSGLGLELSRLESAQGSELFGNGKGIGMASAMLAGIRAVPRSHRSERAQAFVALSARLGEEVLARSVFDARVGEWCTRTLSSMIPSVRREPVLEALRRFMPAEAAEHLSPSELYLLGSAWDAAVAETPGEVSAAPPPAPTHGPAADEGGAAGAGPGPKPSPTQALLREVSPFASPAGDELHAQLEEYGAFLRRRTGISRNSFLFAEPYELLEYSAGGEIVQERVCDLKIRMAELQYGLGIPAFLGDALAELAVRDILPKNIALGGQAWKAALEMIGRLSPEHARAWIEELLNQGVLQPVQEAEPK